MSSARPDHIKDLERRISDLRDELQLQNAIHQSLQTIQYDPSRAQQLVDSEVQIDKLTKQLSDVRRAHHQATKAIPPRSTVVREKFGMPSTQASSSLSSGSGANPYSRPSTPSRKRTHSVANITPQHRLNTVGGKARYHSPSPGGPVSSSPAGSTEIIDLTGDDDESDRLVREHMAAYARRRTQNPATGQYQVDRQASGFSHRHPFQNLSTQSNVASNRTVAGSHGGINQTIPQRPAAGAGIRTPQVDEAARNRILGAFTRQVIDLSDETEEITRPSPYGVPVYASSQTGQATDAARRAAAMAGRYFPGSNIPGYTNIGIDEYPMASTRPGYLSNGFSPYTQSQTQGNRFTPASSLLQEPMPSLDSIIRRTSQYDYSTMTDANGRLLDPRIQDYYNDVMDDPRKNDEEKIKELLSNIRPDMDIPQEERGETPEALKYPLYPHQQLGLEWMTKMEENAGCRGGILADDMGLGKTISTLSLMVTRKSTSTIKTNLIIGPVALIKQWEVEIRKKLKPEHRLSVFLLHSKKLEYSALKEYDVVLTTYGLVAQEWKRYEKRIHQRREAAGYDPYDDLELMRKCPLIHPRSKFHRVILDEAQNIKNKDAQASKGVDCIRAEYRWCLTGTPMMNSVQELYPLIRFLKIKPYNSYKKFQNEFGVLTAKRRSYENNPTKAMGALRVLLKAIMLRRMKNSEINGKPILTLPPKTETIHNCVFSTEEQNFYKTLESKSRITFNKYLRAGTVSKNYAHVLVLLLRLRQACCHPHLNLDFDYADVPPEDVPLKMEEYAKTLEAAVVDRLKDGEPFDCPICLDPVADPTILVPCGHNTCLECFTALTENSRQANLRGEGDEMVKCPSCRAVNDPKKVITWTAFRKVFMPETLPAPVDDSAAAVEDDAVQSDDSETDSESEDSDDDADDADDADQYGDLRDFVVRDDASDDRDDDEEENEGEGNVEDVARDSLDDDEFPDVAGLLTARPEQSSQRKKAKKPKRSREAKKGKSKADEVKPHMLKTLRVDAGKNQEARRKYMRYLKKNWQSSAKVDKVCEILKDIEPTGEKTIIFSQWTALLDLLEIPIKYELGIKYRRYDGGMSRAQRDEAIKQFTENSNVKILLVSLRAGNAGLNLTVASHVIITDPFWNPYVEMQAVDRAHRIGQQRLVHVHRVVVKSAQENDGEGVELDETVEDRILAIQNRKKELIDGALDENESREVSRLNLQQLISLFGIGS